MNNVGKNRKTLLLYFLRGSKRYFIISVIFAMLVSVLDLINPKIISFAVDCVLSDKKQKVPEFAVNLLSDINEKLIVFEGDAYYFNSEYFGSRLYLIAGLIATVAFLAVLCRYFFKQFNARGEGKLVQRMRNLLYEHIIHLPVSWHNANQTGDIIQRSTSDVETIRNFVAEQLTNLIRVVVLIILSVIFMAGINVPLTFVAIILVPVIILYSLFFHNKIAASFQKVDTMEGRLSAMVQENLTGVRVVRAFGREAYEKKRFEQFNEKYMNTWIHLMKLLSAFWATSDFVSGLQVLLIASFGAVFCVKGTLSPGDYIAFISYNAMLTWPVRMLGRVISDMSKAGISIDRIRYIMNSKVEEDAENALKGDDAPMNQDIVFDNVSFEFDRVEKNAEGEAVVVSVKKHDEQAEVLKNVSFTIPAGKTVGILGGTGSGKSTLVHLLDRLFDLTEGEGKITIGGKDIRGINRKWLRENIGIVLQEPYLFSGTLAENIAITQKEQKMDRVKAAAKIASLDEAVEKFGKGYETYVGERGVTLSGGQKQRTAIAQTVIRNTPIMIFDDSLSAVDAETDIKIRKALEEKAKGTTTIIIAHRISTLMNADKIIVLENGRVAEEGTHDELLQKKGIYNKVFNLQHAV